MTKHIDLLGQELAVGDYVIYAALWDRSATLKIGRITQLKTRAESKYIEDGKIIPTVGVVSIDRSWSNEWEIQNNGKELTLGFLNRLTKVDPNTIPAHLRTMLGASND